jgi:hypothetical protein
MTREINLMVNGQPIELDYFVQGFIDHTTGGVLAGLKGAEGIKAVSISIEGDNVAININDTPLSTNPFVSKIVRNTIVGMVSSLKGASEPNTVKLTIIR